jgi:hypothetical protein
MAPAQKYVTPRLAGVVWWLAAAKLALHLGAGHNYGYFIDELYYLACGRHLAWGYVDQPPLIAVVAAATRVVLGESLWAIRLLPALAGAATVLLTGLVARELGGRRFAQGIAALAALVAGGLLGIDSFFSMNAFEPLFWTGCAFVVIRIIRTGNQRLWLWFGVLAGLGLENKHSMLIFGGGVLVGLLATRERRQFRSPWLWLGGLLALLIFLPNLLWNVQHHFPFLELQENIKLEHRNVDLTPWAFIGQEILTMLPLTFPIWLAGLWYFFSAVGKQYRVLGWAWMVAMALIMTMNPRVYYAFPSFPMLFAAGGVAWEAWLTSPRLAWIKPVWAAALVLAGAAFAPFAAPVLPVETYIRYAKAMHFKAPKIETHKLGPLPQIYADEFGWEDMVRATAQVYNSLPPDVRVKTAIFGQNYGQAGAVDLFGPKYELPSAISGHQNYFYWGPRGYTGESMIVMDGQPGSLESKFASVEKVAHVGHPYAMPYEHFDIYYCRGLKQPLSEMWPALKNWH